MIEDLVFTPVMIAEMCMFSEPELNLIKMRYSAISSLCDLIIQRF